jgi:hypothetical protein
VALPIEAHTSAKPVIASGATGAVAFKVKDLATLLPQPETAITESANVVGRTGKFNVMLLESVAFTLTNTAPVGNVQR